MYELRIYSCMPGRMAEVMARFDPEILELWSRHGIEQAGFWTVNVGPSNQDIYYMLKWDSLDERERRWTAFTNDPDMNDLRARTEAQGPLLSNIQNIILKPTRFSSVQ